MAYHVELYKNICLESALLSAKLTEFSCVCFFDVYSETSRQFVHTSRPTTALLRTVSDTRSFPERIPRLDPH